MSPLRIIRNFASAAELAAKLVAAVGELAAASKWRE